MKERPSKIAALCLFAALGVTKGESSWNATLAKNTGFKEEQLRPMARDLLEFVRNVQKSSL